MSERIVTRTHSGPFLIVECENLQTLLAISKVVNESGLSTKVYMEYEVSEYGGNQYEKSEHKDVQDR